MRASLLLTSLVIVSACGDAAVPNGSASEDAPLSDPYLGQAPPGPEPELFAPGIVSTGLHTRDLAITPEGDEIYWSVTAGPFSTILGARLVGGRWTAPEVARFAADPDVNDIEPHIAPDGQRLYFVSNRPVDGSPMPAEERGQWDRADIWVMERTADGWAGPASLGPPVNTAAPEFFPSLTEDGTIYFTREDPETGRNHIWRARPDGDGYLEPERLPEQVNSANQFNAFVAPDESYVILGVFGREDSHGGTDYYVVFRDDGDRWSQPMNLGPSINQARGQEWSPYVSPDGRYFFFMSTRQPHPGDVPAQLTREWLLEYSQRPESGNPATYWMEAGFLDELRAQAVWESTE